MCGVHCKHNLSILMQIYSNGQISPPLRNCSLKNDKKYVLKSWQYLKNNGAGGLLLIFFRKRRKFAVELPTGMQCVVFAVVGCWCWYAILWCTAQCVSIVNAQRIYIFIIRHYSHVGQGQIQIIQGQIQIMGVTVPSVAHRCTPFDVTHRKYFIQVPNIKLSVKSISANLLFWQL